MFGSWITVPTGGNSSTSAIPSHKGPLTFPTYSSKPSGAPFALPPDEKSFYKYFARIRRATDVTKEHLDVLSVSVEYNVPVEAITGSAEFDEEDATWNERKTELSIPNDVANEVMARTRRDFKLGHMYKGIVVLPGTERLLAER